MYSLHSHMRKHNEYVLYKIACVNSSKINMANVKCFKETPNARENVYLSLFRTHVKRT